MIFSFETLWGWPNLVIFNFLFWDSLSNMLSTALLLSAVTKTLLFYLTSCWINSTNVLVFPVPKGPCIKKKFSVFTAFLTAFF